jgi:hypothetical protein
MTTRQLELQLAKNRGCRSTGRSSQRQRRAHQWFNRMREMVENAEEHLPVAEKK